jgi:hypothetical protein
MACYGDSFTLLLLFTDIYLQIRQSRVPLRLCVRIGGLEGHATCPGGCWSLGTHLEQVESIPVDRHRYGQ